MIGASSSGLLMPFIGGKLYDDFGGNVNAKE